MEKNAGRSSQAGDLENNGSLGKEPLLSMGRSHANSLAKLWLKKVLVMTQPLPAGVAPSQLKRYFYSYSLTRPSEILVRESAEAGPLATSERGRLGAGGLESPTGPEVPCCLGLFFFTCFFLGQP